MTCSRQEGTDDGTAVMIVGNKIDLIQDDSDRAVRPQDGQRLAEVHRTPLNILLFLCGLHKV